MPLVSHTTPQGRDLLRQLVARVVVVRRDSDKRSRGKRRYRGCHMSRLPLADGSGGAEIACALVGLRLVVAEGVDDGLYPIDIALYVDGEQKEKRSLRMQVAFNRITTILAAYGLQLPLAIPSIVATLSPRLTG